MWAATTGEREGVGLWGPGKTSGFAGLVVARGGVAAAVEEGAAGDFGCVLRCRCGVERRCGGGVKMGQWRGPHRLLWELLMTSGGGGSFR